MTALMHIGRQPTSKIENLKWHEDIPSYSFELKVHLGPSRIHDALRSGAPHTTPDVHNIISKNEKEFPANFSGTERKRLFLVCAGAFINNRRTERVLAVLKQHQMQDIDLRTLLAIGEQNPALCREIGKKSMRLVCIAQRLWHLNISHVCVLHQNDMDDNGTRNSIRLEPYHYGWSAEHVFVFEKTNRE